MNTMALFLALAAAASADEVTLKGGGRISGVVEEKGDQVVVRTEHGTMSVPRARVERIDRTKSSVLQEYEEILGKCNLSKAEDVEALLKWAEARRMAEPVREMRERLCRLRLDALDRTDPGKLEDFSHWARAAGCGAVAEIALRAAFALRREKADPKDAGNLYDLGLWAKANGLAADAFVLFQAAVVAAPDHEHARRALGYVRYQGAWMTEREVRIVMGLVEFEGEWVTPAVKEAVLTARTLEKERKLLEEVRRRLEEERALARAEFDRQKAVLDARRADLAREAAELERLRSMPACGFGGCALIGPHVHCSRAGCAILTAHIHCAQAACALTTFHRH